MPTSNRDSRTKDPTTQFMRAGVIWLCVAPICNAQAQESPSSASAMVAVYNTRGHPRAAGLDLTLEYPLSWRARESALPDHVHEFIGVVDGTYSRCDLLVEAFPEPISDTDASLALKADALPTYLPSDAMYVASTPIVLSGHPAGILDYKQEIVAQNIPLTIYTRRYLTIYKSRFVHLACGFIARSDSDSLEDQFDKLANGMFEKVARSIRVQEETNVFLAPPSPASELPVTALSVASPGNAVAPEKLTDRRDATESNDSQAVQVIRGSGFLRETTRLAQEAEVREELAAQEAAHERSRRVSAALAEAAAQATQPQTRNKLAPAAIPASGVAGQSGRVLVPLAGGLAIDPQSGQLYGGGQGGAYVPITPQ